MDVFSSQVLALRCPPPYFSQPDKLRMPQVTVRRPFGELDLVCFPDFGTKRPLFLRHSLIIFTPFQFPGYLNAEGIPRVRPAMSFEFITSLKRLDRTAKHRSVGFIPFPEAK
jgi:hypothetical protein